MAWRKPKDFREWTRTLFRHKKKFFFPAVAVMILVMLGSQRVPRPLQTAEAKFERSNDPALNLTKNQTMDITLASIRKKLTEEIRGKAAVDQLIEDLGYTKELDHKTNAGMTVLTPEGQRAKEDMIRQFISRINIAFELTSEDQDRVRVTFTDPRRKESPRIANQIVTSYVNHTREQLKGMLAQAKGFFQERVDHYKTEVTDLENKKLRFLLDNPGLDPENPTASQNNLIAMTAAVDAVTSELEKAKAIRESLVANLRELKPTIEQDITAANPELVLIQQHKTELENQLAAVRAGPGHPSDQNPRVATLLRQVIEIDQRIAKTKAVVSSGTQSQPNTVYLEAKEHLAMVEGQIVSLTSERDKKVSLLNATKVQNNNLFPLRADYLAITRNLADANKQLTVWDEYYHRTEAAAVIDDQSQGVRLRVVDLADEGRPSAPTLLGIVTVALVLGLGAGGLLVLASEVLDHSFRNVEHAVDELKLPVLGTVNEIVTPQEAFRRKVLNTSFYPAIGGVMVLILMASLALAYMSLQDPDRFDKLVSDPRAYFHETFLNQP